MKLEFEPLTANDVECRIGTIPKTGKGLSLLLYKDARCDMRQLDKAVGPMNWQRKHEFKNNLLYCSVGIYDEDKQQWVWKEDVGTESNTQKEKGQASDSFKRACTNWGIGRELYTAPFIWISSDKAEIKNVNGRFSCEDKFIVTKMELDENRVIKDLVITKVSKYRDPGGVVYRMNAWNEMQEEKETNNMKLVNNPVSQNQLKRMFAMMNERKIGEEQIRNTIKNHFKKEHFNELSVDEYDVLIKKIEEVPVKNTVAAQQTIVDNYGQGNYNAGGYA